MRKEKKDVFLTICKTANQDFSWFSGDSNSGTAALLFLSLDHLQLSRFPLWNYAHCMYLESVRVMLSLSLCLLRRHFLVQWLLWTLFLSFLLNLRSSSFLYFVQCFSNGKSEENVKSLVARERATKCEYSYRLDVAGNLLTVADFVQIQSVQGTAHCVFLHLLWHVRLSDLCRTFEHLSKSSRWANQESTPRRRAPRLPQRELKPSDNT